MAKLALPSLLLVLVLFTSGMQICIMADNICHDGLGSCNLQDLQCDAKCKNEHPGQNPLGDCAISPGSPPLCTCYFDCVAANAPKAPPKPKRCMTGLGVCSYKNCGDLCCNAKCGALYKDGHAQGYCIELEQFSSCNCEYDCGANRTSNSVNLNANCILPIIPILGSYFLY